MKSAFIQEVEEIGSECFANCNALCKVQYSGVNVFEECTELDYVIVPVRYYKAKFCGVSVLRPKETGKDDLNSHSIYRLGMEIWFIFAAL